MIQICENGHNRIAYDDNDPTEHDGCPYCSMYKDMSQYLQEAKKRRPRTPAEAEEMVDALVFAVVAYEHLVNGRDTIADEASDKAFDEQRAAVAALIAALTGGGE